MEKGGSKVALEKILSTLSRFGSSNIIVIGLNTGLPGELLLTLLNELEEEGKVRSHTEELLWEIVK